MLILISWCVHILIYLELLLGKSGVRILVEARSLSRLQNFQTGCGSHPTSYWLGTGSFQGVNRPVCKVKNSPPVSTEMKNEWSCTSTPLICLQGRGQGKLDLSLKYIVRVFNLHTSPPVNLFHRISLPGWIITFSLYSPPTRLGASELTNSWLMLFLICATTLHM